MKKKLSFSFLLLVFMSMTGIKAYAHDFEVVNADGKIIYYVYNSDGTTVSVSYRGTSSSSYFNEYNGDIVIPESVTYNGKTYSVTSIGDQAFVSCRALTSVKISNSVKLIDRYAFGYCSSLTSVTIPNSVTTIGEGAFRSCSGLTSITIPSSVKSIGRCAFEECTGLTSVTIPNNVTNMGEGVFIDCTGLTSATIGNGVTSISSSLFSGCSGLTSITIPKNIRSIGVEAFRKCRGITTLTIPNWVTSIGVGAFDECSGLTSVTIQCSPTVESGTGIFGNCNNLKEAVFDCKTITALFTGNTSLENVTINESVTSIGSSAFYGCSGLSSVTIPNSVTSIDDKAFSHCSGLSSITIPYSVTSIGDYAFLLCSGLTSITIGNSVTSIGDYTFRGCSGLTRIVVETGNAKYDSRNDCNAIIEKDTNTLILGCKKTSIPNGVTSIGAYAFEGCSELTSITIPHSVTLIDEYSFKGCNDLTSVIIPNSVTSISINAFQECSGISTIVVETGNAKYDSRNDCNAIIETNSNSLIIGCNNTIIPNSVTSIGIGAFAGFSGLTSVTIPNSVMSIGNSAFQSCSGLTSVTIPHSVTSIGAGAFRGCSGLTSITIGNSVTSIGNNVFVSCSSLTDVYCHAENVPSTGKNVFWVSDISSATLHVPEESIEAYTNTEPWNYFNNIVALTESDPGTQKCSTPTIACVNGKLKFSCETEGVIYKINCIYDNTNSDTTGDEFVPGGTTTAHISVFAKKVGYLNSDVVTADIELQVGKQGDVNQDGVVSITDAVSVVNIILNGEAAAPAMETPQELEAVPE